MAVYIAVYTVLMAASCATGGGGVGGTVPLDRAIREAAQNIENNVPAGQKVAVLNFSSPTDQFSEYVIDELSIQLANGKKLVVVDRRELDLIRQEEQFQMSGEVSDESAQSIGKKLGAQIIVSGSLNAMGGAYRFRIRALNVETAVVETGSTADVSVGETKVAFMLSKGSAPAMRQSAAPATPAAPAKNAIPDSFARVEGGTFQMGNNGGDSDEKPAHTVTVKGFYLSKYPVTQKEWFEVMGTTIRQQQAAAGGSRLYGEGDNYPMYHVSWFEAVEYCNRLSVKEGLTPAYSGAGNAIACDWNANGYRLPTEAEWEYAAKGGGRDPAAYEYAGSGSADAAAWYAGNSGGGARPIATKSPNSLGLYDMSGNVWEWCWDWYGDYSGGAQTDPRGAPAGSGRVGRGGSWSDSAQNIRSTSRNYGAPSNRGNSLGFRLARTGP